jgi:hypothetical protein
MSEAQNSISLAPSAQGVSRLQDRDAIQKAMNAIRPHIQDIRSQGSVGLVQPSASANLDQRHVHPRLRHAPSDLHAPYRPAARLA